MASGRRRLPGWLLKRLRGDDDEGGYGGVGDGDDRCMKRREKDGDRVGERKKRGIWF